MQYLFWDRLGIVKDDLHVEARSPACNRLSNTAETDKPKSLAVNIMAKEHLWAPHFEFSRSSKPIRFDHAAGCSHEQGPRKVRRRFRQNTWRVRDDHATLGCRFDVDVIEAHGEIGNDFEPRTSVQHFAIDDVRQQR